MNIITNRVGAIIFISIVLICGCSFAASGAAKVFSRYDKTLNRATPLMQVTVVEDATPEDVRLPSVNVGGWQEQYNETGMTFVEYVTSKPTRPSPERHTIYIKSLGNFSDTHNIEKLCKLLSAYFCMPVKYLGQESMPKEAWHRRRRKYDADKILLNVASKMPDDGLICACITDKEIYSGRLRAVFGLAYSDIHSCIVSGSLLCSKKDSISNNQELYRMLKVIAHEIGHSFGLSHCSAHRCTMNGTMGFQDIERAPLALCGPCLRKLEWNIGFDRLKRYENIIEAMDEVGLNSETVTYRNKIRRIRSEQYVKRMQKASEMTAMLNAYNKRYSRRSSTKTRLSVPSTELTNRRRNIYKTKRKLSIREKAEAAAAKFDSF